MKKYPVVLEFTSGSGRMYYSGPLSFKNIRALIGKNSADITVYHGSHVHHICYTKKFAAPLPSVVTHMSHEPPEVLRIVRKERSDTHKFSEPAF